MELLFSTIFAISTYYQFDLIRRFIYMVPLITCDPLSLVLKEDKKYLPFLQKEFHTFLL